MGSFEKTFEFRLTGRAGNDPEYSTTGIFGDATLATREKGRKVVEGMTREWIRALRAFATEPVAPGR